MDPKAEESSYPLYTKINSNLLNLLQYSTGQLPSRLSLSSCRLSGLHCGAPSLGGLCPDLLRTGSAQSRFPPSQSHWPIVSRYSRATPHTVVTRYQIRYVSIFFRKDSHVTPYVIPADLKLQLIYYCSQFITNSFILSLFSFLRRCRC